MKVSIRVTISSSKNKHTYKLMHIAYTNRTGHLSVISTGIVWR